jgi:hypothetical protein
MTRDEAIDAWAAMTAEERLAMAETAPKVAEAWEFGERYSARYSAHDCEMAVASIAYTGGVWIDGLGPPDEWSTDRFTAQRLADERLIEEGWILK